METRGEILITSAIFVGIRRAVEMGPISSASSAMVSPSKSFWTASSSNAFSAKSRLPLRETEAELEITFRKQYLLLSICKQCHQCSFSRPFYDADERR